MRFALVLVVACQSGPPEDTEVAPVRTSHHAAELAPIDRTPVIDAAPPNERLLAAGCAEVRRGDEHPPSGKSHWRGTAFQFNTNESWTVDLDVDLSPGLAIGAKIGAVSYPSLGCSGELFRARDIGGSRVVVERIRSDPKRTCVDAGTLRFACAAGGLEYRAYYPDGRYVATSTLSRAQ